MEIDKESAETRTLTEYSPSFDKANNEIADLSRLADDGKENGVGVYGDHEGVSASGFESGVDGKGTTSVASEEEVGDQRLGGPPSYVADDSKTAEEREADGRLNGESGETYVISVEDAAVDEKLTETTEEDLGAEVVAGNVEVKIDAEDLCSLSRRPRSKAFVKPGKGKNVDHSDQRVTDVEVKGGRDADFSVGDFVWGEFKNHPWWPGRIYDPSFATEYALKYKNEDRLLVAYYGDNTFSWCNSRQLKPFVVNFEEMSKQSSLESFVLAVEEAVDEFSRHVETILSCVSSAKHDEGSGGAEQGGDGEIATAMFQPAELLDDLRCIACFTSVPNVLKLTVLKIQLSAFYRAKGWRRLMEPPETGEESANSSDQGPTEDCILKPCAEENQQDMAANSKSNLSARKKKSISEILGRDTDADGKSSESIIQEEKQSVQHASESGRKERKYDGEVQSTGDDDLSGHGQHASESGRKRRKISREAQNNGDDDRSGQTRRKMRMVWTWRSPLASGTRTSNSKDGSSGEKKKSLPGKRKLSSGEEKKNLPGKGKLSSGEERKSLHGKRKLSSGEEQKSLPGKRKLSLGEERKSLPGKRKPSSGEEEKSSPGKRKLSKRKLSSVEEQKSLSGKRKLSSGEEQKSLPGKQKPSSGEEEKSLLGKRKPSSGEEEKSLPGKRKPSLGEEEKSLPGKRKPSSGEEEKSLPGKRKLSSGEEQKSLPGKRKLSSGEEQKSLPGERKMNDSPAVEKDGIAQERSEKGFSTRERKKSKYLSPPYTSPVVRVNEGKSRRSEGATTALEFSDNAKVGQRMARVAKQIVGSTPISENTGKTSKPISENNGKTSKEETDKAGSGHGIDDISDGPRPKRGLRSDKNGPISKMLSAIRLAALTPQLPRNHQSFNAVKEFLSSYRSSEYKEGANYHSFREIKAIKAQEKRNPFELKSGPETPVPITRRRTGNRRRAGKRIEEEKAEAEEGQGTISSAVFVLTFPRKFSVPSKNDLNKIFRKFGTLYESKTEVSQYSRSAKIFFLKSKDAEGAVSSCEEKSPFGAAKVSYKIQLNENSHAKAPSSEHEKTGKQSASASSQGEASEIKILRQKLEVMISMLANGDGKLSHETKTNLEKEMKELLRRLKKMGAAPKSVM